MNCWYGINAKDYCYRFTSMEYLYMKYCHEFDIIQCVTCGFNYCYYIYIMKLLLLNYGFKITVIGLLLWY